VPAPAARHPVDINTATAEEFGALPGFHEERVRLALSERAARGGFGSVAEFASAIGLPPHEYAPLRDVLVCHTGHRPDTGPSPYGRVLDV
jgi:DNA uptake protein ComE-like DNA-binding protein